MRKTNLIAALPLIAVLSGAPLAVLAQEDVEDLGTFKDWNARKYDEGGAEVCTMFSRPLKSEGDYERRGEVYVFVTHRPAANRIDEVSFTIGYTFKKETPVVVRIGGAEYELFTKGGNAWTRSGRDDRRLVRAMRAGATMVVDGVSSRGTKTTDTFSLSGFSAAHNKISEACRAR